MATKGTKRPASDRTAKVAQLQRQARAGERRRSLLLWGGLAAVVVALGGLIFWAIASNPGPQLGDVETFDGLSANHIDDQRLTYEQSPPVGGDHHSVPLNCGVYETAVPDHHAVHSLEHGAVWLTYQPDLPADQVETLRDLADQEFVLLSPYEGQEFPVMATAWGLQLGAETADAESIEDFVREYVQGEQTLELGAPCTGTSVDLLAG